MKDYASSGIRRIGNSVGETTNKINRGNNANSRYASGFSRLIGVVGGLAIGFGVLTAASALFFKGVELEQTKVKFEVLLGSVERGTAMLKELNEYANFTPFSNAAIIKSSETMLGFGIVQEKIMGNMTMLGDVAMGNEQKLGSLSLVYSQIQATGRLMGQDLLQLINTGFNPLQIISENTGLSMGHLKDQMEKGAISAGMVEEAFRLATSEGGRYYGMTEKMSESAGGKWSTLMGKFQHTISIIGEKFSNWISPMLDIGISVVNNILPFGRALRDIYQAVTQNTPVLIAMTAIVSALGLAYLISNASLIASTIALGGYNLIAWLAVTATGALTAAQTALNFVMSMNPISLVIIAIGALIAIVALLWNKFDWLRGGVMGIWEVMKGFGDVIKNFVINRFTELLKGITGIGQALYAFFTGDFKDAFEIGKKAVGDLMGVGSGSKLIKDGIEAAKTFSTGYNKGLAIDTPKTTADKVGEKAKATDFVKASPSSVFDSLMESQAEKDKKKKRASKGDSIVSGGSKMTNITVTIGKLQDKTEIHVASVEKGLDKLGEKVQEILLRSVNSVNQMQTS